jgi:hypothetical protein
VELLARYGGRKGFLKSDVSLSSNKDMGLQSACKSSTPASEMVSIKHVDQSTYEVHGFPRREPKGSDGILDLLGRITFGKTYNVETIVRALNLKMVSKEGLSNFKRRSYLFRKTG